MLAFHSTHSSAACDIPGDHNMTDETFEESKYISSGFDMIIQAAQNVELDAIEDEEEGETNGSYRKVAVACTNCKKAHVACNSERPCRRCDALSKDCIDTTHKKRGVSITKPTIQTGRPSTTIIAAKPVTQEMKINIYLSLDGTISKAGSEAFFIFGREATSIVGQNICEFMPDLDEREWIQSSLDRFSNDHSAAHCSRIIHFLHSAKGSCIYYHVYLSLSTMIENVGGVGVLNRYCFLSFRAVPTTLTLSSVAVDY